MTTPFSGAGHWTLEGLAAALPPLKMPAASTFSARGWSHRWLDLRWRGTALVPAGGRLLSWTPDDKGGILDVVDDWHDAPGSAAGGTTELQLQLGVPPLRPTLSWRRSIVPRDDFAQGRPLAALDESAELRGRTVVRNGAPFGPLALVARDLLTDHALALHVCELGRAGNLGVHVTDALVGMEQHVPSARLAPCGKVSFGSGDGLELLGWRWTATAMLPIHAWLADGHIPVFIVESDRVWVLQDVLPADSTLRGEP